MLSCMARRKLQIEVLLACTQSILCSRVWVSVAAGDETCRCQEQLLGGAMSEMEMDLWPRPPTEAEFESGYVSDSDEV
jgi:hypothetical protein